MARIISMDLSEYEFDTAKEYHRGVRHGVSRMIEVQKAIVEKDFKEAVCILTEEFESDQSGLDDAIDAFGLRGFAEKYWSE